MAKSPVLSANPPETNRDIKIPGCLFNPSGVILRDFPSLIYKIQEVYHFRASINEHDDMSLVQCRHQ